MIALAGFLAVIWTFISMAIGQVFYYYTDAQIEAVKVINNKPTQNETILAEQRGKLASYGWTDREKGVVSIPIDEAMLMVIQKDSAPAKAPSKEE